MIIAMAAGIGLQQLAFLAQQPFVRLHFSIGNDRTLQPKFHGTVQSKFPQIVLRHLLQSVEMRQFNREACMRKAQYSATCARISAEISLAVNGRPSIQRIRNKSIAFLARHRAESCGGNSSFALQDCITVMAQTGKLENPPLIMLA